MSGHTYYCDLFPIKFSFLFFIFYFPLVVRFLPGYLRRDLDGTDRHRQRRARELNLFVESFERCFFWFLLFLSLKSSSLFLYSVSLYIPFCCFLSAILYSHACSDPGAGGLRRVAASRVFAIGTAFDMPAGPLLRAMGVDCGQSTRAAVDEAHSRDGGWVNNPVDGLSAERK